MTMQTVTFYKCVDQSVQNMLLFLCQIIRMFRVNGWEIYSSKFVSIAANGNTFVFIINFMQKQTFFHSIFRMASNDLRFYFKQNDCNCSVHSFMSSFTIFISLCSK